MNEISIDKSKEKIENNKKSKFFLVIGDFYYEESANNLKAELLKYGYELINNQGVWQLYLHE